jgi:NADPH:quinone reductase
LHAIRQYAFGPPEALLHEEVADPVPGPGQVRIVVAAAGVHLMDTALRAGASGGLPLPQLPTTPGREAAGTVDMVGPDVDTRWLGRRVVAYLGHEKSGGYAELAVADEQSLHELPDGVDVTVAVAMIGTGRTVVGVLEQAPLTADDVVLITAAAGGMGTLLVQAACAAGATVIGLAGGPDKVRGVRGNGAHAAVDYSVEGWPEAVRSVPGGDSATVVFDGVGGALGRQAAELLVPGGRHLYYGWASAPGHFAGFTPRSWPSGASRRNSWWAPRCSGAPGVCAHWRGSRWPRPPPSGSAPR